MQEAAFLIWLLSLVHASWWHPQAQVSWDYHLSDTLKTPSKDIQVYDIDLVENSKESIAKLKKQGFKVVCYFSAGSYEDWRPDKDKFKPADIGKPMDGWKGESWIDTNLENVRNIMKKRMDLAQEKKCDAVDPDNIEAYDNENGLGLTKQDAIDYVKFLAEEAHRRGLAVGLKNGGAIVKSVVKNVDFCVQEQCVEYDECSHYRPFIDAKKPVLHVEYPKGEETLNNKAVSAKVAKKYCDNKDADGFSTIIKNINLDAWIQKCS